MLLAVVIAETPMLTGMFASVLWKPYVGVKPKRVALLRSAGQARRSGVLLQTHDRRSNERLLPTGLVSIRTRRVRAIRMSVGLLIRSPFAALQVGCRSFPLTA